MNDQITCPFKKPTSLIYSTACTPDCGLKVGIPKPSNPKETIELCSIALIASVLYKQSIDPPLNTNKEN